MSHLNILVTEQAVNCGDHAQDVTKAITPKPGETVEELALRTLARNGWLDEGPEPNENAYLTIRLGLNGDQK